MYYRKLWGEYFGITLFSVCFLVLSVVFFEQWVLGIEPCRLCFWQRYPYYLLLLYLSLNLLIFRGFDKVYPPLILFILFSSIGLAILHIGVEQGLWQMRVGCETQSLGESFEHFVSTLENKTVSPPCYHAQGAIFYVPLSVYNLLLSGFLFYKTWQKYYGKVKV